jgi:exodeoxyribonuclease V alpha subunit
MIDSPLHPAFAAVFGPAERHGSAVIAGREHPDVHLAAALALWAPVHGHTCIDLGDPAAQFATDEAVADAASLPWPAVAGWRRRLAASPVVRQVTGHDTLEALRVLDDHPLVLHGTRVYTQRQWVDESAVVAHLHRRRGDGDLLSIIVGGPGTGKTHTVSRLVAQWLSDGLQVDLAAPTGKAAARLAEALAAAGVPARASTLHRLLGPLPRQRTRFVHDADRRLRSQVVVIDEASMVSLPMMARLLDAMADDARLVLVGDPDQLESVEVGSVLADVVRAGDGGGPLASRISRLDRSYRQAADSPIQPLAAAIRRNQPETALQLLGAGHGDLRWLPQPNSELTDLVSAGLAPVVSAARLGDAEGALSAMTNLRVLCAHRRGPFGVQSWNAQIAHWLALPAGGRPAPGSLLMVTRNDSRQVLNNGDTGVVVHTADGGRVAFPAANVGGGPAAATGGPRLFGLAQLDDVEPALAMTVHKSQGSEYDTVVVVLPPADSPLATRELMYTAVTRARQRLVVVGSEAAVRACIAAPTRRVGGLAAVLQSAPEGQLRLQLPIG